MNVSDRMINILSEEEGVVLKAYRCPAGVLTIGVGHTSNAGAPKVSAGMVVSRERAFDILRTDLSRTFEPRVARALPGAKQNVFDGATSFDFNTGRIHNASWVAKFKTGRLAKAEASFKSWNKGGGRVLKGLVRRRGREAEIIFRDNYGGAKPAKVVPASRSTSDDEVLEYQTALKRLGFYTGELDGMAGQQTKGAVKDFQKAKGLTVDGIVGPATRATLDRALNVASANKTSATGGVAGAGGDAVVSTTPTEAPVPADGAPVQPEAAFDWIGPVVTLVVVAAVIWIGFWVWRNRGRLFAGLPEGAKDFVQDKTGVVIGRRVAA